jgi:hypothetical protein
VDQRKIRDEPGNWKGSSFYLNMMFLSLLVSCFVCVCMSLSLSLLILLNGTLLKSIGFHDVISISN